MPPNKPVCFFFKLVDISSCLICSRSHAITPKPAFHCHMPPSPTCESVVSVLSPIEYCWVSQVVCLVSSWGDCSSLTHGFCLQLLSCEGFHLSVVHKDI